MTTEARAEVQWFAEQMEEKLKRNDHKGHWSNCTATYLVRRLSEECTEVRDALRRLKEAADDPGDTEQVEWCRELVVRECADIANFAMMIADNAKRLPSLAGKGGE